MKCSRLGQYLKTAVWVVPLLFVLGGIALALVIIAIEPAHLIPQRITDDTTAALQILYLIAFSMLTLTGLVLSPMVGLVQRSGGNC